MDIKNNTGRITLKDLQLNIPSTSTKETTNPEKKRITLKDLALNDTTNFSKPAVSQRVFLKPIAIVDNHTNISSSDALNQQQLNNINQHTIRTHNNVHVPNPNGVRVVDKVYQDYPNLKVLDGILKVEDYNDPEIKKLVSQLAKYPNSVLLALKKHGLKEIEVANLTPIDMGSNSDLKNVVPRNWPEGSKWENVPGVYNPNHKSVVAGTLAAHGSEGLLSHETGHAVGDLLGFDNSSDLKEAHKRLYDKISPYLKGSSPGALDGRQEMFAEGLATLLEDGEAKAVSKFDQQFVDFLKNKVLNSN